MVARYGSIRILFQGCPESTCSRKGHTELKLWREIELARDKIQKVILRTPTLYSDTLSKMTGKEVFLKLANLQKTGSFKIRGAYYKLSRLSDSKRRGGVV